MEIQTYQQQWFKHVQRMTPEHLPRKACLYRSQGSQSGHKQD